MTPEDTESTSGGTESYHERSRWIGNGERYETVEIRPVDLRRMQKEKVKLGGDLLGGKLGSVKRVGEVRCVRFGVRFRSGRVRSVTKRRRA